MARAATSWSSERKYSESRAAFHLVASVATDITSVDHSIAIRPYPNRR